MTDHAPICAECVDETELLVRVDYDGRQVWMCAKCREGPDLRKSGPAFSVSQSNPSRSGGTSRTLPKAGGK